eukprot:scaffold9776_cov126-Isochrysis_galbana.AAC.17
MIWRAAVETRAMGVRGMRVLGERMGRPCAEQVFLNGVRRWKLRSALTWISKNGAAPSASQNKYRRCRDRSTCDRADTAGQEAARQPEAVCGAVGAGIPSRHAAADCLVVWGRPIRI